MARGRLAQSLLLSRNASRGSKSSGVRRVAPVSTCDIDSCNSPFHQPHDLPPSCSSSAASSEASTSAVKLPWLCARGIARAVPPFLCPAAHGWRQAHPQVSIRGSETARWSHHLACLPARYLGPLGGPPLETKRRRRRSVSTAATQDHGLEEESSTRPMGPNGARPYLDGALDEVQRQNNLAKARKRAADEERSSGELAEDSTAISQGSQTLVTNPDTSTEPRPWPEESEPPFGPESEATHAATALRSNLSGHPLRGGEYQKHRPKMSESTPQECEYAAAELWGTWSKANEHEVLDPYDHLRTAEILYVIARYETVLQGEWEAAKQARNLAALRMKAVLLHAELAIDKAQGPILEELRVWMKSLAIKVQALIAEAEKGQEELELSVDSLLQEHHSLLTELGPTPTREEQEPYIRTLRHIARAVGSMLDNWVFISQPAVLRERRTATAQPKDNLGETARPPEDVGGSMQPSSLAVKARSPRDWYGCKALSWLWSHPEVFFCFAGSDHMWAAESLQHLFSRLQRPSRTASELWTKQTEAWQSTHGNRAVTLLILGLCNHGELLRAYSVYLKMTGEGTDAGVESPRLSLPEQVRRKLIRLTGHAGMHDVADWLCRDLQKNTVLDENGWPRLEENTLRMLVMHYARRGSRDLMRSMHRTLVELYPDTYEPARLQTQAESLCAAKSGDLRGVMQTYGLQLQAGQPFGSVLPDDAKTSLPSRAVPRLMRALINTGSLLEAESLYERVRELYHHVSSAVFDPLMDGYTRRGDISSALSLYDELKANGAQLTIRTYTSLVRLFAQRKDAESANRAVQAAIADNIKPDRIMWNSLLNAFVESGSWKAMEALAAWMRNHTSPAVQPSGDTLNILFKGHVLSGAKVQRVQMLFDYMGQHHRPDSHTWALLLQSYCDAGKLHQGFGIFRKLDNALRRPYTSPELSGGAGLHHFTIMLHAYVRHKRFDEARQVFQEMQRRGIQPSAVTWGVIVSAYSRMHEGTGLAFAKEVADRAALEAKLPVHLREPMWSQPALRQSTGSEALYMPILMAATRSGNPQEAQEAIREMASAGVRVDSHSWIMLLDIHRKSRDLDAMERVWKHLVKDAIKHRDGVTKLDVDNTSNAQDEKGRLKTQPPLKLPAGRSSTKGVLCVPLSMMLDAYSRAGRHEDVGRLWAQVRELGFAFDPQNWNDLVIALLRADRLDDAMRIFDELLYEDDDDLSSESAAPTAAGELTGSASDDHWPTTQIADPSHLVNGQVKALSSEISDSHPNVEDPIEISGEVIYSEPNSIKQLEPIYPNTPRFRKVRGVEMPPEPPQPKSRPTSDNVEPPAEALEPVAEGERQPDPAPETKPETKTETLGNLARPFYPTLLQHDFGKESAADLAASSTPFFDFDPELDIASDEAAREVLSMPSNAHSDTSISIPAGASTFPSSKDVDTWISAAEGYVTDPVPFDTADTLAYVEDASEEGSSDDASLQLAMSERVPFDEDLIDGLTRRANAVSLKSSLFVAAPSAEAAAAPNESANGPDVTEPDGAAETDDAMVDADEVNEPPPYVDLLEDQEPNHLMDLTASLAETSLFHGPPVRRFWFASTETLQAILARMRKMRRTHGKRRAFTPGSIRVDRALERYPRAARRLYLYRRSLTFMGMERLRRRQKGWYEGDQRPDVPTELNPLLQLLPEAPHEEGKGATDDNADHAITLSDLERVRQDPAFRDFAKTPSRPITSRDILGRKDSATTSAGDEKGDFLYEMPFRPPPSRPGSYNSRSSPQTPPSLPRGGGAFAAKMRAPPKPFQPLKDDPLPPHILRRR